MHREDLPGWCNTDAADALSELSRWDERVKQYDHHIEQATKEDVRSRQLMQFAGIGPTTATATATATAATVGQGRDFAGGHPFCVWLGLVSALWGRSSLDAVQAQHQRHGVCWRLLKPVVLIKRFGLFVQRMNQQSANAGVLRHGNGSMDRVLQKCRPQLDAL
jgi:hypothetical protein